MHRTKLRRFGYDLEIFEGRLAASTNRPDDEKEENIEGVYIFSEGPTNRWTLQQKLFTADDSNREFPTPVRKSVDLHMRNKTLVTTVGGDNFTAYIFRTSDGTRWSQNQKSYMQILSVK